MNRGSDRSDPGRAPRPGAFRPPGLGARLASISWRDLALILTPVALLVAGGWITAKLVRSSAPGRIRLLGGSEGSSYRSMAERYKKIIEGYGVKVEIVTSRGAQDNLRMLADPKVANVDVGFVQGGLTDGVDISHLMSLGSLFAQPLMVYYRTRGGEAVGEAAAVEKLTELAGKRIAIGLEGSGTRALAVKLLKTSEIDHAPTVLVDVGGAEAADDLIAGKVDAAFLMGDSATPEVQKKLRAAGGIALMNFRQAEGYARRLHFLSRLTVPEGAFDLAKDYPPRPIELVGPTVELVARRDLHPALSDLLISAAREVHGTAGMFRAAGEYPAPVPRDFPISQDAERYYKSGGQFLYKHLPFWLASLVDRLMVLVLPLFVLVVPATRLAPAVYRWRFRSRIYRWYGALMAIEHDHPGEVTPERQAAMLARIAEIERAVNDMKTQPSFADQLYVLREHVALVRRRVQAAAHHAAAAPAPPLTDR